MRVTPLNIEYWKTIVTLNAKQFGQHSTQYKTIKKTLAELIQAEKNKKNYISQAIPVASKTKMPPSLFHNNLDIVIDGHCGSSCLDSLDYFVKLPNVRLV